MNSHYTLSADSNLWFICLFLLQTYPDYLKLTTGIFVENSRELRSDFVSTIRNNVNASVESLDLKNNSSGARDYLNDWAAKRTDGKIRNLFPTGNRTRENKTRIVNEIRFRYRVRRCFDKSDFGQCVLFQISVGLSVRREIRSRRTVLSHADRFRSRENHARFQFIWLLWGRLRPSLFRAETAFQRQFVHNCVNTLIIN